MSVTITNRQRSYPVNESRLAKHAGIALETLNLRNRDLSIVVVGDSRMRTLNRTYRKIARTTDVLSFSPDIPLPPGIIDPFLGEIVISAPRAFSQAKTLGISPEDEFTNLMIHGVCHLVGYDHEKGNREEEEMKAAERTVARVIQKRDRTLRHPGSITGKIPDSDTPENGSGS